MITLVKNCEKCSSERPIEDFYGKDLCYSCVYKTKINLKTKKVHKKCMVCMERIPEGRRVVCCPDCAHIQATKQKKNHWTRCMTTQPVYFGSIF